MSNTDTRGVGNLGALGQAFLAATDIAEFLEIWLSNDLLDHESAQVFSTYYASYLKSFTPRMRGSCRNPETGILRWHQFLKWGVASGPNPSGWP